jgi:arylsulfatase A-like enzyme
VEVVLRIAERHCSAVPRGRRFAILGFLAVLLLAVPGRVPGAEPRPSILVITVDALRADRLGSYAYDRDTSPNIDRLLDRGVRFERAWTPEPLTGPAMCSMVTGLYPHQHGASRNGLRMQPGLDSMPRILARHGYATAAVVGTWTLKDNLTLLGEHFGTYSERLDRKRWFGLINGEATGEDVTDDALEWLEGNRTKRAGNPFFLWVHYIEPHAPYRFHERYAKRLGLDAGRLTKSDRYDTEVAAVDHAIGRLLEGVRADVPEDELIVVFTADHGESLGEHDYWGHGRNLHEPGLRIPLGITWEGRIPAATVSTQATLLDLAPTLLELAGLAVPESLPGESWAGTTLGGAALEERLHCYQAHRGAVHGGRDSDRKRSKGLLAVGIIEAGRKEILRVVDDEHKVFDLAADPQELHNQVRDGDKPSRDLLVCLGDVSEGLGSLDRLATQGLDDETVERLRALGYLE